MTQSPHDEQTASNPQKLREQGGRTREELGQTVEALAARTAVTSRVQEKAAEVQAGHVWEQAAPETVRHKAARTAQGARDNRVTLLMVGNGAAVVGSQPPQEGW